MSHVGFVDEVAIHVTGGRGGDGCVAFRREKHVPRGGPSGGDGGHGGSVVLEATRTLNTLSPLRHRGLYRAESGKGGQGSKCHGRTGASLTVQVPLGTVVIDSETGERLADLCGDGDVLIVARGGRGGRGNACFATPTRRAPREHEEGEPGEDRWVKLEMKLLADVGLVGLPNAGKSTLISRISAARPRIAAYPFTTLVPNLGVVDWDDDKSYVVADIPGLIEGSHLGEGLGDQFLRHVERTSVLLHLVEVSELASERPADALRIIEAELEAFDPTLLARPRLLVATKIDAADPGRLAEARQEAARLGLPLLEISAVVGTGVTDLIRRAGQLVEGDRLARVPAAQAAGDIRRSEPGRLEGRGETG